MAKKRVHDLAKEFGLQSKVILAFLKARGEFVKSASSTLEPSVVAMIREEFGSRVPSAETSARMESTAKRSPVSFGDIEAALAGSPYSLPNEQRAYIEETFLPIVSALQERVSIARNLISAAGRQSLGRINRTSEIYESNKIEGLGPDLATTSRLLAEYSLDEQVGATVAQDAIQRCIDAEPKVRDVIGLGAARYSPKSSVLTRSALSPRVTSANCMN